MEPEVLLLCSQDPLLTTILSHMKPVEVLPNSFFKTNLNITFPSTTSSSM